MNQRPHLDLWREACDGIREVQDYSPEEHSAYRETWRVIPPPVSLGDGRFIYTTQKGLDALYAISAGWRAADVQRRARIQEGPLAEMAVRVFGSLLAENSMVVWSDDQAALNAFKARLADQLDKVARDVDHYFPCHVVSSVEAQSFAVGPVRFLRREEWLDHVASRGGYDVAWANAIKAYWVQGTPLPPMGPREKVDAEEVIDTAGRCQWIAAVRVLGNELDRSAERAQVATRLALDAIGMVLPADSARNLRGPGDPLDVVRTGRLSQYAGRGLNIGSHIDVPDLLPSATRSDLHREHDSVAR